MTSKYEPRGKVQVLVTMMRAARQQRSWPAEQVAQILEVPRNNIPAYVGAAIKNGVLFRQLNKGKSEYSLQAYDPKAPPDDGDDVDVPVEFNAALWSDGELVIYGAQVNEDDSFTLTAEQTSTLCRLLHGQGPAE